MAVLTDGERWTREQLARLRAARFRPAGVARFLVAAQRRSAHVRRARPDVARRERAWAAAGAGSWLGLAVLGVEPFHRRVRAGVGGWALVVLMLDWHMGMLETPDGRPRNLGPADAATLVRAWLVPAVADHPSRTLCGLGFATDLLDGRLAAASGPTRLGRDLEGLVDAAFVAAALRGAQQRGWLGPGAVVAETARIAAGLAYAIGSFFGRAEAPPATVLRAARAVAPVRAAGLLLAGSGRRRLADALIVGSTLASAGAALRRVAGEALGSGVHHGRSAGLGSGGAGLVAGHARQHRRGQPGDEEHGRSPRGPSAGVAHP